LIAVYNTGGNLLPNQHMVTGIATLNGAAINSTATVTLTGQAAFSGINDYVCTIGNVSNAGGTAFITPNSGSSFTLTGGNNSNDSYFFTCVGNNA
jgi:hypothetical protein